MTTARLTRMASQDHWSTHSGDLDSVPCDKAFDVVSAHNVLEYVEDRGSFVSALASKLATDGTLSLVFANAASVPITTAVRTSDPVRTRAALKDGMLRIGMKGESKEAAPINESDLVSRLAGEGVLLEAKYGLRIFNELMTSEDKKSDTAWFSEMIRLELDACDREPYRSIARHTHLVFRRHW